MIYSNDGTFPEYKYSPIPGYFILSQSSEPSYISDKKYNITMQHSKKHESIFENNKHIQAIFIQNIHAHNTNVLYFLQRSVNL